MPRNLLLPPAPRDPRCTGRTTAIALDLIARALKDQGQVRYATDHHLPGTVNAGRALESTVNDLIEKMDLKHIKVTVCLSSGPYLGHVRVVSNIWED